MQPLELDEDTYAHLRAIARRIHRERASAHESIQPTALLHEAWGKASRGRYQSKAHFMAVAARAMRQILVDRARARMTEKHGAAWRRTTMSGLGGDEGAPVDLLDVDAALTRLRELDADAAAIAEMFTFGGMSAPEIAEVQGVSVSTVWRSWRFGRAVLSQMLEEGG